MHSLKKHWLSVVVMACLTLTLIGFSKPASAQDTHPPDQPDPVGKTRVTLDDTDVLVVYSRPHRQGSGNIFGTDESGALVPYGQVWRTGANEAPRFTTTNDLIFSGDIILPEGTYSVFITPGPEEWTLHFKSGPGLSVVNVTVPVFEIEEEVDQFTISLDRREKGAEMVVQWGSTEVHVPFTPADKDGGTGGGGDPCYRPKCKCSDGSCSVSCC